VTIATILPPMLVTLHDKNVPALSNSPIMPGPKLLTQGRETADGRWQEGDGCVNLHSTLLSLLKQLLCHQ
jgi:hypothetical protein